MALCTCFDASGPNAERDEPGLPPSYLPTLRRDCAEHGDLRVLRRATDLDAFDRRICHLVWVAWREGRPNPTVRELACGRSTATVWASVWGVWGGGSPKKGGSLIENGWLAGTAEIARSLHPGPRLAGMDHGWPLEVVG